MTYPSNSTENTLAALRAGSTTPESFLDAFAAGNVWVPIGTSNGEQATIIVVDIDDVPHARVYTSEEQLIAGAGPVRHMVAKASEFAASLPAGMGMALNLGGRDGLPIHPTGVQQLRPEHATVLPPGSRIRLGKPTPEPTNTLAAVAAQLASLPHVSEARHAMAQIDDQPPTLLLHVTMDADDEPSRDTARQAIASALAEQPLPYPVDTVFAGTGNAQLDTWFIVNADPFYRRTTPSPDQ